MAYALPEWFSYTVDNLRNADERRLSDTVGACSVSVNNGSD